MRYEATPAPGYNFVRWQSDGGSNPVICDNATSDSYTGSICQFATYRDLQTRAVFSDTTPPPTPEITSGPNQPVNGPTTFAYSLPRSDPTFKQFECRVGVIRDGAIVSYLHDWQACGSDSLGSELSEDPAGDGNYRFEVRARDYSSNNSAVAASRDWTVDKTSPQTTLNSAVGPAEGSTVASRSANFQFSMDEAGSLQCQLDAGSWSSCGSPTTLSGLSDGSHTFRVRAVDTAGNVDETSAKRQWTVDTIKPKVAGATPTGTGVKRNTNITATFSEKMNRSTLTKSTFKLYKVKADGSTTQITNVTVSLNFDALKATLNPFGTSSTLLAANTKYKVVVTIGAKDLANNPLDQNPTPQVTSRRPGTSPPARSSSISSGRSGNEPRPAGSQYIK